MSDPATTLLTRAQIEAFRFQARVKREAVFLAPQLIEHVAVLTERLRAARLRIEALRLVVRSLGRSSGAGEDAGRPCPVCHDAHLRAAARRMAGLLGDEAVEVDQELRGTGR